MAGVSGAHVLATNPASLICELPVWAGAGTDVAPWEAAAGKFTKIHPICCRGPLWVKMSFHQVITKPLRGRESEP